jgi:type I restriction enzyme S subunit
VKKEWGEKALGDLCKFEQGTSPTLKTQPGIYPLVVTASYRRTAVDYQFDGPAVCIPLVSSTGHGNAALHRVHYQHGKFALSNLLVAVTPREDSQLDAKYLWRYLSATKDRKLVPLMQGTANVSLKEQDIQKATVPVPPMAEQHRIVAHLDAIEDRLTSVQKLREEEQKEKLAFLTSMAHRWDLTADAKRKRGWQECELGDVLRLAPEVVEVDATASYPNLGIYSYGRGTFSKPPINGSTTSAAQLYRVRSGQFIYSRLFAFEGAYAFVEPLQDGYYVSNEFPAFDLNAERILPEFLFAYFKSSAVWTQLAEQSIGLGNRRQRIHPEVILSHRIHLPPLNYQRHVSAVFRKVIHSGTSNNDIKLNALLPSLLDRIFNSSTCMADATIP